MIGTDVETELFLQVAEVFEEEKECEHSLHDEPRQRPYHGGKAEWYTQTKCLPCGRVSPLLAVCDTWVKSAETQGFMRCKECREKAPTVWIVKERIK